jgi:hypothetical protein
MTGALCAGIDHRARVVVTSQNRSKPSPPAAAIIDPSGAIAASSRRREPPLYIATGRPVSVLHERAVPSLPAVKISRSLSTNRAERVGPICPFSRATSAYCSRSHRVAASVEV